MRLSTKARYGARALVELALAYPEKAVPMKNVAREQHISRKYLEHIFADLKATGIIRSVRGMRGGYGLARSPSHIDLYEVFAALEGSAAPVDCVDHPEGCPMKSVCPTRDTWVELKEAVENVLKNTTLQDLAKRKRQKTEPEGLMYHI
ncbi:MAG: RrF2 family transcriptional regulator [Planctomycetes bacterium]|nr:RrF2 family transcriptional regulator [Planctomycetota bacterium]